MHGRLCWPYVTAPRSSTLRRNKEAQAELRKKLLAHKEIDAKVRTLREQATELKGQYDKTEDDLKALQSIGQIIGEVLRQLDDERCKPARAAHLRASRRVPLHRCTSSPPPALQTCCLVWIYARTGCAAGAMPCAENWRQGLGAVSQQIAHCACGSRAVIVKASSGPRYVVGCRAKVDKAKLVPNTRVTLDMTTLTIMRYLPREVPPPPPPPPLSPPAPGRATSIWSTSAR